MAYIPDKFAQKAKKEGYRARSAYKLLGLQNKFKFLKRGQIVLDLGSAPGSWLQVVGGIVGLSGKVMGIDIAPVKPVLMSWVKVFQKDIKDGDVIDFIRQQNSQPFDVVLSDVAPSTTGMKERDQAVSQELAERVFEIARQLLKTRGVMVVKVFQGTSTPQFLKEIEKDFSAAHFVKPEGSKKNSKEFYIVGLGFRGLRS